MVEEISTDEVAEKVGDESVQIVDIRNAHQFASGHIPGAINIPFQRLPREIPEHDWGEDIVVACPIGQSSIQAARLIESFEGVSADARVASMAGGYEEWSEELETTESEERSPF